MCFGSKDESNDPGPKPAQIPQQPSTSSAPPPSKAKMSPDYAAPQGPPPSHGAGSSNDYAPPPGPPPAARPDNGFAPPVGPPPSHQTPSGDDFAPPPGPPPGSRPGNDYAPPPGPPPGSRPGDEYAPPVGPPPGSRPGHEYAPPPGPPPGSRPGDEYAPPPGPPPGARPEEDYAPPVGPPPPGHRGGADDCAAPPGPPPPRQDYGPPPGPPPSKGHYDDYGPPPGPPPSDQMPKKHNWEEAVPEAPCAPPPNIWGGHDFSWANNATEEQANAGEDFCRLNPLHTQPEDLDGPTLQALQQNNFNLICQSNSVSLAPVALGVWKGHSRDRTPDTSVIAWPPIYSVKTHSPFATGRKKVIYYEVNFTNDCPREIGFALGFTALPYPPFRLPGWHRASLAVHGDDGHKYINDMWGGKDFTAPFKRGETVGIGMEIEPGQGGGIVSHVFFTRDGHEVGRWDLHEETDKEQDRAVTGLEGFHDLHAAVGLFEKVGFEVVFAPWRWKWQGHQGQ